MTSPAPRPSDYDGSASEPLIRRALIAVTHLQPRWYGEQYDVSKRALDAVLLRQAAEQAGIDAATLANDMSLFRGGDQPFAVHQNMPSSLPALDRNLTNNKHLTKRVLAAHGVAVARGRVIESVDEALEAFRYMDPPVVAKPISGSGGRGVTVGITTPEELRAATEDIVGRRRRILIEEMINSIDLRVMTVNGRAVATTLRVPANVIGDARSTIRELVAAKNEIRSTNPYIRHSPIRITPFTDHHLELQGLTPESIPDANQRIFLHFKANISSGGDSYEAQDHVHPDLLRLAEQASACFPGASHAGLDILAERLDVGLDQQRAIVCEVNLNNEIPLHVYPMYGESTNVHHHLMEGLRERRSPQGPRLVRAKNKREKGTKQGQLDRLLRSAARFNPPEIKAINSVRDLDTETLRGRLEEQTGCTVQFQRNLIFIEDGENETVLHRTGNSVVSSGISNKPGALHNLARELAIPALGRHHLGVTEREKAHRIFRSNPGQWRLHPFPTEDGGKRQAHNVRSASRLDRAWDQFPAGTRSVRMTQRPSGFACDVLLIDGDVAACLLVSPPAIIGDGSASVQRLLQDKIQQRAAHSYLRHVPIEESLLTPRALARRDLTLDAVPAAGSIIALARSPFDSLGPDTVGLKKRRFPTVVRHASDLAEAVGGRGLLSVKFVARHVQDATELEWALWRIDPNPSLARFAFPGAGETSDVYTRVADQLLNGYQYQLPVDATSLWLGRPKDPDLSPTSPTS